MGPIREFVARAEMLNYDSLWMAEGILSAAFNLEPISLLSYIAALTSKLRLGVAVMLLTLRNPIQLAKATVTLDYMSGGRFDMGIGMGHGTEALFGYAREGRVTRFEESLAVMKALWTQPQASFSGKNWNFENIAVQPRPVQQPHPPIWFGARHPTAIRRAARLGDAFMGQGSSSFEDVKNHYSLLFQYLEEEGRDPESFPISKRVYLIVDDDKARGERNVRKYFSRIYNNADLGPRVSLWGGRQECLDKLGEMVQAGATHLLLDPLVNEREHLELLSEEIVPYL
jgi:probable F420-dependent oxidoreductase